jgi:hypothetical protein
VSRERETETELWCMCNLTSFENLFRDDYIIDGPRYSRALLLVLLVVLCFFFFFVVAIGARAAPLCPENNL